MTTEANASTSKNLFTQLRTEHVNNCVVTKSQVVVTGTGICAASLFDNLPFKHRLRCKIAALGSVVKNRWTCLRSGDDYFHLMNMWSSGYHHFLAEVLPKFILFEEQIRNGLVLMPKCRPRFISEFLDEFGFDNIVETEGNVFIRNLTVVSNPHSGHYNPVHLQAIRDWTISRTGFVPAKPGRKIYVTRRNARARRVVNEDEVIKKLEVRGFECLDLDNVGFREQVAIFSECSEFVAIHGAGLTNAIFMPEGGSVTELFPVIKNRSKELNACYERLCFANGLRHQYLFCERVQNSRHSSLDLDDIVVDSKALDLKTGQIFYAER